MSTAVAKRRDDGGPSRLHLAPARTTPKALLDRKCGNHLCQLTNLHIFDCVPSPMDLCAQPSATPSQTLSEGDKPPETDGVFKPVPSKRHPRLTDAVLDARIAPLDFFGIFIGYGR